MVRAARRQPPPVCCSKASGCTRARDQTVREDWNPSHESAFAWTESASNPLSPPSVPSWTILQHDHQTADGNKEGRNTRRRPCERTSIPAIATGNTPHPTPLHVSAPSRPLAPLVRPPAPAPVELRERCQQPQDLRRRVVRVVLAAIAQSAPLQHRGLQGREQVRLLPPVHRAWAREHKRRVSEARRAQGARWGGACLGGRGAARRWRRGPSAGTPASATARSSPPSARARSCSAPPPCRPRPRRTRGRSGARRRGEAGGSARSARLRPGSPPPRTAPCRPPPRQHPPHSATPARFRGARGAPGAWQGVELDDGRDVVVLEGLGVVRGVEDALSVAVRPAAHRHPSGGEGGMTGSHQMRPSVASGRGDRNARNLAGTSMCMSPFSARSNCPPQNGLM